MLSTKHLLGIKQIQAADIELIFKQADHFKEVLNRPIKKVPSLRDVTIVNLFFENSTRTRISFELAEKRLNADVLNFTSSSSSVSKGETLIDTVNNILAMKVDMVVMRHPSPGAAVFLNKNISASIINAGDGTHEHPTQALLDAYSIREKLGTVKDKKILILGDIMHSRVALSNIYCLQKLGASVKLCCPPTLMPHYIENLGVEIEYDVKKALQWCDSLSYGLNKALLQSIDKDIVIMHPGPINRGVEINSDVADGKQSIILDQVENGVAVRMAILYLLHQASIGVRSTFF
jgi:aspartate carbamoyltransferase catalytic subunit